MTNLDLFDQPDHIEPVQPSAQDINDLLQALDCELVPAQVLKKRGQKSKSAARKATQRKNDAEKGLADITMPLPVEMHPQFRVLSNLVKAGMPLESALREVFGVIRLDEPGDLGEMQVVTKQAEPSLENIFSVLPKCRYLIVRWLLQPYFKFNEGTSLRNRKKP